MRYAGRQAATRNNKCRSRRDARNRCQTFLRFNVAKRSTREHKSKLFAGRLVKDRNVLPRVVCHRDYNAWHAFALKQRCEQLSGGATGRVNCGCDNTEPLKNPSYVDSTSPWITVGRRTPHFGERHHFVYRRRDVEGGVYGEGDDLSQRDFSQCLRPPPKHAGRRKRRLRPE